MKYGKTEINAIVEVLEQGHETYADAAKACLDAMEKIFASRAKFVVVGQLASSPERSTISPNDDDAIRISLGWYSTEGDAYTAARSLWSSLASGETFRTWVLPVHHGTPADFHKARKGHYEALELKARERRKADLRAAIDRLQNVKPDEGVMGS